MLRNENLTQIINETIHLYPAQTSYDRISKQILKNTIQKDVNDLKQSVQDKNPM